MSAFIPQGQLWPSFQIPRVWPEPGPDVKEKMHKDKEDAKELLKLRKALSREQIRLSALRLKVDRYANSQTNRAVVLGGNTAGPADQMSFGKRLGTHSDEGGTFEVIRPLKKLSDQSRAGYYACALANCNNTIIRITERIAELKASQEGDE